MVTGTRYNVYIVPLQFYSVVAEPLFIFEASGNLKIPVVSAARYREHLDIGYSYFSVYSIAIAFEACGSGFTV
jgi:hypothetical protein